MSSSIRLKMGIALLLAIAPSRPACAQQGGRRIVEAKAVKAKIQAAKSDEQPADALNPAKGDGKSEKADAAATQKAAADLEVVAAGLRVLFGGVAMVDDDNAVEIEVQAVDGNADNEAMGQQFINQYRPILKAELGFIRLVCSDLTPEQRPKIREPAEAAMKQTALQMAKRQNQMQRGIGVRANPAEPSKAIRDAVAKALKETLTEVQMARYSEAANQRTENRKRVAILSLVSRLDGQLFLTAEQRDKISESLSAKWQDSWEKWSKMMTMYGDRYFPTVPDQCVTAHLNAEQKTVWQGLQKIDFGGWWGGGGAQNLDDDGWWGGEPANKKEAQVNGGAVIQLKVGF